MTTDTPTSDRTALYHAICAAPGEDTPRLVLADWLDENGVVTQVKCPACLPYADDPCPCCNGRKRLTYFRGPGATDPYWKDCHECNGTGKFQPGYYPARDPASGREEGGWTNCKTCNGGGNPDARGPGFVRSTADATLAEFIRVQVELANHLLTIAETNNYAVVMAKDEYKHWTALRDRETVLLDKYRANWIRAGVCRWCEGRGTLLGCAGDRRNPDCPDCDGTGDIGMLPDATDFARGFPNRVTVPTLADVWGEKGPTPRARAWVKHFPIAEIVALDREPHSGSSSNPYPHGVMWCRYASERCAVDHWALPSHLFDLVAEFTLLECDAVRRRGGMRDTKWYPTRELALSALARGLAQAVREHP